MSSQVYIDGHAGTTGLRIRDWLAGRPDLQLLSLPDAQRKDPAGRRDQIAKADVAVLCLPEDAAREAATWANDSATRLLDASSAHRVVEGWVYGLPELAPGQRAAIEAAARVSNPGCYASAYILLTRPLVDAGLIAADTLPTIHALSGYSGGGRPMIERWEDAESDLMGLPYEAPYALDRLHKHIPEMRHYSGLHEEPQFVPAVGPFRCGMRIELPLHASHLDEGITGKRLCEALSDRYRGEPYVRVNSITDALDASERSFDPTRCNDTNRIELQVIQHPSGHVLLMAILDNLGKGAAGVAIQCLNLMLGSDETTGLPG
jgi:N-acetyl-gamma-glutamyl-phosphate reductase